jgi:hypothetical protein
LKRSVCLIVLITFLLACSNTGLAQSRTITGVVTNGTTNKPASGDDVILIKLGQGMEEESRTKTDAHGKFSLTMADGSTLHLVRVRHDNVNYHEPAPPNVDNLQITVYNAAAKTPGIKLLDQSEVYQADGAQLQVIELFRVSNAALPPLTQPSLEIYLPEGASVRMAQAVTEAGMPVKVTVVPQKEKNKYSILYPLRPGTTQIEMAYTMPYTGTASIRPKVSMTADHFYVVTAKGIRFTPGTGTPFHVESHWPTDPSITEVEVHSANGVAPANQLSFEISGAGMLPQSPPAPAQAAQGEGMPQPQQDNRPGGGLGEPNEKPDPLRSGQWLFLGVLSLFLAAGATYVYTSNQSAPQAAGKAQAGPGLLLDAMKEEMFQLETDRLQGKISQNDYESAKAALDTTLKRAVQRQKSK